MWTLYVAAYLMCTVASLELARIHCPLLATGRYYSQLSLSACYCVCLCVRAAGSAVRAAADPPAEELPGLHGSSRVICELCWTSPAFQGSVISSLSHLPFGGTGATCQASIYYWCVEHDKSHTHCSYTYSEMLHFICMCMYAHHLEIHY